MLIEKHETMSEGLRVQELETGREGRGVRVVPNNSDPVKSSPSMPPEQYQRGRAGCAGGVKNNRSLSQSRFHGHTVVG